MPIRINLLTEALAEEDLRRRDPVKRTIFIGAFLVALSLVWFSSAWLEYKVVQIKYSQIENQIQSGNSDFSKVQGDLKRIADGQKKLSALQQLSTNRFLQGTLLNALQQIYLPNVQLTRIKVDQSYGYTEGAAGRPASSTEKITLTLDAKDFSPNPGDQVNHYKDAVAKMSYFKSMLNQTNGVRLLNLSPPQSSWNSKPFVLFTLECRFSDQTR